MLLTSGQVSLAISSTVVFIFTTALFLCGYIIQQKTVNDIREAIKPQPRPVHTNLYIPPNPNATPGALPLGDDGVQIIEITESEPPIEDPNGKSVNVPPEQQSTSLDDEQGLIQGADGGFLKRQRPRQRQRQRKHESLLNKVLGTKTRAYIEEQPSRNEILNSEDTSDTSVDSGERLSRAARRKLIKDEFVKLAGEDLLNNPNTYKRRRLW